MKRLTAYLARLFVTDALILFGVVCFLLWLVNCLRSFDVVSVKGQSIWVLGVQALYTMPPLAIAFFYVCVGIGLARALQALQTNKELHIIHTSYGLGSLWRATAVVAGAGVVCVLLLSNFVEPAANRRLNALSATTPVLDPEGAHLAALRRPGPVAIPGAKAVTGAFLAALAIYVAIGFAFRFQDTSPQSIALGAILIFGIAYLLAQGLAGAAPVPLMRRMVVYSLTASLGYFALHHVADALLLGPLPATPAPGPLEWVLMILAVVSFGLVAIAQSMFPLWAYHPAAAGLRVHLSNGLYANALFDRMLGGWTLKRSR